MGAIDAQTAREIVIYGPFRNAHAMETQARELMERHPERLILTNTEFKTKLTSHLQEDKWSAQAYWINALACGETSSALKTRPVVMANARNDPGDGWRRDPHTHLRQQRLRISRLSLQSLLGALAGHAGQKTHGRILELRSGKRNRWHRQWVAAMLRMTAWPRCPRSAGGSTKAYFIFSRPSTPGRVFENSHRAAVPARWPLLENRRCVRGHLKSNST